MNWDAIFSDGTREYVDPWQPKKGQSVTIRLRVAHGEQAEIFLCANNNHIPMKVDRENETFDYYKLKVNLGDTPFQYYFELREGDRVVYYDRCGASDELRWQYHFTIVPGFSTPEWANGAVMYQILVDRFKNSDPTNDVVDDEYHYISRNVSFVPDWNRPPSEFDVTNFYGGDLQGVKDQLYYLKSLGVEVIYFNPLFVSPSNHKYDTQDYDYIDPHYGKIVDDGGETLDPNDHDNHHASKYKARVANKKNLEASNKFFAEFVQEAHEKGIRVILDGVFNHCGSFNKWLDREGIYEGQDGFEPGAYVSKDSPYHDYFRFYPEGNWPYNNAYDGWWGHDTLPKLNYENSQKLCDYILDIARKWVSPPYNADGWRLDVAADLGHSPEFNHKFWAEFRDAVKKANPNAIILAEHYGDASSWLGGDQWDTIMNYDAFMEPVSYFMTGMEKHSDRYEPEAEGDGRRFEMTMQHCMTEFLTPSLYCAMNQLSNHDHSRFLTRTNHKVGRVAQLGSEAAGQDVNTALFKEAALIQMTWPGAPTLYYGDEAGVVGFTDPDNRRTYPWGNANYYLIDYHRDIIFMHRFNEPLRVGSFLFLQTGKDYLCYARFTGHQKMIIAINRGDYSMHVDIPAWRAEVPDGQIQQIFVTNDSGHSILPVPHDVVHGILSGEIGPHEGYVFSVNV